MLDVPRTLEYLETRGVPVVGVGTDLLPAFYTSVSDHTVDCRLDSAADIAALLDRKWALGLDGGVVIAVPVPSHVEQNAADIESVIRRAIGEMRDAGIAGKETTPFLLRRIAEATGGSSLDTNIALAINNAQVGAEIAVELARTNHG